MKKFAIKVDPYEAAKLAGLHYSSPEGAGYKRLRTGRGFRYIDSEGRTVNDREFLRRVRSLVIPPAWTSVYVSSDPGSHIQAVGWDAKGRKQYRYHPLYREVRDYAKFDRLLAFGRALPKIRAAVNTDLAARGLPQRKVIAVVVRLLEVTCIRVGNEEYERVNGSFGLTTLKNRHVTIEGSALRFRFKGKSGQAHDIQMKDTRLARIVRECQCIPGYELFQWVDSDGQTNAVRSEDVNAYLSEVSEAEFTAKDFRTWVGTCTAAQLLGAREPVSTKKELKQVMADMVKQVAQRLGNRPATCRKYYIHPVVFTAFENGALHDLWAKFGTSAKNAEAGLRAEEVAVLNLLESAPALLPQVQRITIKRKRSSSAARSRSSIKVRVVRRPAVPQVQTA